MLIFLTGWVGSRPWRWCWPALLLLAACQPPRAPVPPPGRPVALPTAAADHLPAPITAGQAPFFALLHTGDSLYARKDGDKSLARSLTYYTRAQELAAASGDTLLLAEAVFARGRVYDAWNKEPQKTIDCFQQATDLFRRLPAQRLRYYYAWHLVAHAYDKVPDTVRTAAVLRAMQHALAGQPVALLRRLPFTVELALIATEGGHYALADSLLSALTRRAWIRNDPETYDYLTHYYLVHSRLDVLYRHRRPSPYLDSLQQRYHRAPKLLDRLYLSQNLARLYAAAGQYRAGYAYQGIAVRLGDSLVDGGDLGRMRVALVAAEQREETQAAAARQNRLRTIWSLSAGLVVISLLSFHLHRQSRHARAQARDLAGANCALATVNGRLDEKVAQVELLNLEIQHRVKNNLHMIFSLLHLQERRTDNEEVIEQLQAARLRVESIAALHNQLLTNPDGLDLTAYLRTLISAVVACLADDRPVVTHLSTEVLDLPLNSYFALSLILNEWVTNSIKYADTGDGLLEINVRMRRRATDTCIEYADNGAPTATRRARRPAGASGGLGTQIITLLSRQLGGTLSTRPGHPFHYELCLPDAAAET
jgi:two-component sensor histidine kinase